MPFFLRLLGITNAALWFGSAIFFTVAVWPAFSSSDMLKILPRSHAGAAVQLLLDRYFAVGLWCGGVALMHLLLELLYGGGSWRRWRLYFVVGMLGWGLLSGLWLGPKLKRLHLEVYGVRSTPARRQVATRAFQIWSSVLQISHVVVALGLWVYIWEMNSPGTTAK